MQFVLRIEKKSFQLPKKREKRANSIPMFVNYVSIRSPLCRQTSAVELRAILGRRDWQI